MNQTLKNRLMAVFKRACTESFMALAKYTWRYKPRKFLVQPPEVEKKNTADKSAFLGVLLKKRTIVESLLANPPN